MAIRFAAPGEALKNAKAKLQKERERREKATGTALTPVKTTSQLKKFVLTGLPAMVQAAADKLAEATTAAAVLDAKAEAGYAYTQAKAAARLAKAKDAYDEMIPVIHRASADSLEIEAYAKRRLADEYDLAQAKGAVAKKSRGRPKKMVSKENHLSEGPATAAEVGLTKGLIHDARQVRDAIVANPTVIKDAVEVILAQGDEPTRAALKKAIAPAVKAGRKDKTAEKKTKRATRERALAANTRAMPGSAEYGVILADLPWTFEVRSEAGMDRSAENHYPTMTLDEIKALPVAKLAADDCILFLWVTAPMTLAAGEVVAAWGFTFKTEMIWNKVRKGEARGTGYWVTGEHEKIYICTRGNPVPPAPGEQWRSNFSAAVSKHSAKPDTVSEMIDELWPNTPKVELSDRGKPRAGWMVWPDTG